MIMYSKNVISVRNLGPVQNSVKYGTLTRCLHRSYANSKAAGVKGDCFAS